MADANVTLEAIIDTIESTLKIPVYLVDELPTVFKMNCAYVLAPETVHQQFLISSGTLQDFQVRVIVPTHEVDSNRYSDIGNNIRKSLAQINMMLSDTFKRMRIVGTGNIYEVDYEISLWEANSRIYAASEITLSLKSMTI